jgi:hypothetical protein
MSENWSAHNKNSDTSHLLLPQGTVFKGNTYVSHSNGVMTELMIVAVQRLIV